MILRALLGLILSALILVPTADAGGAGRLKFGRTSGGGGGGGELGTQTVYWGPNTLVGNGAADICAAPCVQPWTFQSGTPLNYTRNSAGLLAPKDGAVATAYNNERTTGPLVSATFNIVDALGRTKSIINTVDASRAGTRTITNDDAQDGAGTYNSQLAAAIARSSYGDVIGVRSGTKFNTASNTGVYTNSSAYRLRNTRVFPGAYTGDNPVTIRPETGGTVQMGHLLLDGQSLGRLNGLRIQGINFYGEIDDTGLVATTATVNNLDLWDNRFESFEGDWLNLGEVPRAKAVASDANSVRWRLYRNTIVNVKQGFGLRSPNGTANMGELSYSDPALVYHEIVDNKFYGVFTDVVAIPCATGAVITGNLMTDKTTSVNVGGPDYPNPFNASVQPHGDALQFDYAGCGYGRYAGPIITGNVITRGNGRDSLPFWTSPPYPDPNTPGPTGFTTPNPAFGSGDFQGIFRSNTGSNANRTGYNAVWVAPTIRYNFIQNTFANALSIGPSEDPVVEYNTVISDNPSPANLPFANALIQGNPITGTAGSVKYNVSTGTLTMTLASGASVDYGSGSGTGGTTNTIATIPNYANFFAAPQSGRRSYTDALNAFKPKIGGSLFVNPNQPAGVWCPDGSERTAAACP